MKFKTTNNKELTISLLSGHSCIIYPEFTEVHDRFHAQAYANGCVSELNPVIAEEPKIEEKYVSKYLHIKNAITKMREEKKQGYFTKDGYPNLNHLSRIAGINVSREDLNAALEELDK